MIILNLTHTCSDYAKYKITVELVKSSHLASLRVDDQLIYSSIPVASFPWDNEREVFSAALKALCRVSFGSPLGYNKHEIRAELMGAFNKSRDVSETPINRYKPSEDVTAGDVGS